MGNDVCRVHGEGRAPGNLNCLLVRVRGPVVDGNGRPSFSTGEFGPMSGDSSLVGRLVRRLRCTRWGGEIVE